MLFLNQEKHEIKDDANEHDEDSNEHVGEQAQTVKQSLIQETCTDDPKDIESDIKILSECLIDDEVKEKLLSQGDVKAMSSISIKHCNV